MKRTTVRKKMRERMPGLANSQASRQAGGFGWVELVWMAVLENKLMEDASNDAAEEMSLLTTDCFSWRLVFHGALACFVWVGLGWFLEWAGFRYDCFVLLDAPGRYSLLCGCGVEFTAWWVSCLGVCTARSDRPWVGVTSNLCVMRRYYRGEGELVSTF